jgi:hypothetical protein
MSANMMDKLVTECQLGSASETGATAETIDFMKKLIEKIKVNREKEERGEEVEESDEEEESPIDFENEEEENPKVMYSILVDQMFIIL